MPYLCFNRRADKILSMDSTTNGEYTLSKLTFDDLEQSSLGVPSDGKMKVRHINEVGCWNIKIIRK